MGRGDRADGGDRRADRGTTIQELKAFIDRAAPGVETPDYLRPVGAGSAPPGVIAAFLPADLPVGDLAAVCLTEEPFSVDLATGLRVVAP